MGTGYRKFCGEKKTVGVRKKQTFIEDNQINTVNVVRWNKRIKRAKEFDMVNSSQGN